MVNRNLSQQEWMALSENQFQSAENQLKSIDGQNRRLEQLTAQVEALKGQNQAMQADGQRVLSAYQSENEQLRRQVNERRRRRHRPPVQAALYGPTGPQVYQRPDGAVGAQKGAAGLGGPPEVKIVSFSGGPGRDCVAGREGQHALYRQHQLSPAQQLCAREGHRRRGCERGGQQPDRSASGGTCA